MLTYPFLTHVFDHTGSCGFGLIWYLLVCLLIKQSRELVQNMWVARCVTLLQNSLPRERQVECCLQRIKPNISIILLTQHGITYCVGRLIWKNGGHRRAETARE